MKLRLERKEIHSSEVATFWFAPEQSVAWQAGQSVRLEVPCGFSSDERRFTISSAPHEGRLAITTQLSQSDFKQALFALQPSEQVDGYAIEGAFTWQESAAPHLFIAGGIGLTPFYAMLKDRKHHGLPLHATLLHVTGRSGPLFAHDLHRWQANHSSFTYAAISKDILHAKVVQHLQTPSAICYISGAPSMVRTLTEFAQATSNQVVIKTDSFTGYRALL